MSLTKKTESPLSPLLLDLEQNTALDGGVALLQPALDSLSSKDGIGGVLRGKQMGHALHPVMVQLPLGTFMSAALLDVTGVDRSGRSAQLLTGVGLASVLPSILTGLAELATASSEEKRVGIVHAGANAIGAVLQVGALRQRARGRRRTAAACSLTSVTALSVGGYLGGHLSVARKVGSHDPVFG